MTSRYSDMQLDALRELVQVQGEEIDALRKELAALKGTKSKTN